MLDAQKDLSFSFVYIANHKFEEVLLWESGLQKFV